MLKLRILTALLLLPIVIYAVVALSAPVFNWVALAVVVAMAMEWAYLIAWPKVWQWLVNGALLAGVVVACWQWQCQQALLYLGSAVWLLATLLVFTYPRYIKFWQLPLLRFLSGILLLLPLWAGLWTIRALPQGNLLLLYVLMLMWVADSAAYFVGCAWGKNKLAPQISPGKSWQGLYGALIASALFAVAAAWFFTLPLLSFLILSVVTVLFSIIGDLTESMVKRQQGVKDSSHLLPGHGGLLDRLDSLIAAAPVFALGMLVLK